VDAHERALPRLEKAHHLMWEVREKCNDESMREYLLDAMRALRKSQRRLKNIESEARRVVES
jgi:hypothetical protein